MDDYLRFLKRELDRAIIKFEEVDTSTGIRDLSAGEVSTLWLQETAYHPARGTIHHIRLYWLGEVRRLKKIIEDFTNAESLGVARRKPNALSRGATNARK